MQVVDQQPGLVEGAGHLLDAGDSLIHFLVPLPGTSNGLLGRQRGLGRIASNFGHRRSHFSCGGGNQFNLTNATHHTFIHFGNHLAGVAGTTGQYLTGAAHLQQQAFQMLQEAIEIPRQCPQLVTRFPVDPHRQIIVIDEP